MAYVIIVIILLIIIGPILAVLPSKRQKDQMQKRQTAMKAGISVNLTRIDDPDPDPEKYLSNTGKPLERVMALIAYRLPRLRPGQRRQVAYDWALERKLNQAVGSHNADLPSGWCWGNASSGPFSEPLSEPLSAPLSAPMSVPASASLPVALREYLRGAVAGLPDDVVRVEERKNIISAYWKEQGGAVELAKVIDFLTDCAAITDPLEDDSSASGGGR